MGLPGFLKKLFGKGDEGGSNSPMQPVAGQAPVVSVPTPPPAPATPPNPPTT